MSVIVDTTIWSLAFRRARPQSPYVDALAELLRNKRAKLIGPVRQEILSGINDHSQFSRLRTRLRSEPDYPLEVAHFERAAEFLNLCRAKGVQGSNVDFLICAISDLDRAEIFTTDRDFDRFAKILPIRLFRSLP